MMEHSMVIPHKGSFKQCLSLSAQLRETVITAGGPTVFRILSDNEVQHKKNLITLLQN